jgi:glutamine---fructose-6-phosphate transaminase (isomerizing)
VSSSHSSEFLSDIAMHPAALRDLVSFYRGEGQPLLDDWADQASKARRVVFSGMGTSEFSPELIIQSLSQSTVDASTIDAGELLHYPRSISGLLVLISQSGESIETRRLAERISDRSGLVAIVNYLDSTIARAANLALPMCAGHEAVITSKTYVNTLAVLHLMAKAVQAPSAVDPALESFERLADAMPEYDRAGIDQAAVLLGDAGAIQIIGRGPTMAAARQAALTFMEGARVPTCALTGGAFRHGPFEIVGPDHRCVFFIPGGATFALLSSMAHEVAEKGSHVVAITDQEMELPESTCRVLRVPDVGEELFALSAATTQELLLDAVARRRGLVAGDFLHGGKVTTRE